MASNQKFTDFFHLEHERCNAVKLKRIDANLAMLQAMAKRTFLFFFFTNYRSLCLVSDNGLDSMESNDCTAHAISPRAETKPPGNRIISKKKKKKLQTKRKWGKIIGIGVTND
jgi:hypothetical protein